MKLLVFCLFAVCCCAFARSPAHRSSRDMQRLKLQEVINQLKAVRVSVQHSEQMMNTPPNNVEDCCSLSALQCFRANMQVHFNVTERNIYRQLYRSLKNHLTERGLDFQSAPNINSACQDCDSHPKEKANEFFLRLESLIQKAINRLSLN